MYYSWHFIPCLLCSTCCILCVFGCFLRLLSCAISASILRFLHPGKLRLQRLQLLGQHLNFHAGIPERRGVLKFPKAVTGVLDGLAQHLGILFSSRHLIFPRQRLRASAIFIREVLGSLFLCRIPCRLELTAGQFLLLLQPGDRGFGLGDLLGDRRLIRCGALGGGARFVQLAQISVHSASHLLPGSFDRLRKRLNSAPKLCGVTNKAFIIKACIHNQRAINNSCRHAITRLTMNLVLPVLPVLHRCTFSSIRIRSGCGSKTPFRPSLVSCPGPACPADSAPWRKRCL